MHFRGGGFFSAKSYPAVRPAYHIIYVCLVTEQGCALAQGSFKCEDSFHAQVHLARPMALAARDRYSLQPMGRALPSVTRVAGSINSGQRS
jgi:hypothetical protein